MPIVLKAFLCHHDSNKSFLVKIFIRISLKCIPKVSIDNMPVLVQIMAWHRTGDKPLSAPTIAKFADAISHLASMK